MTLEPLLYLNVSTACETTSHETQETIGLTQNGAGSNCTIMAMVYLRLSLTTLAATQEKRHNKMTKAPTSPIPTMVKTYATINNGKKTKEILIGISYSSYPQEKIVSVYEIRTRTKVLSVRRST